MISTHFRKKIQTGEVELLELLQEVADVHGGNSIINCIDNLDWFGLWEEYGYTGDLKDNVRTLEIEVESIPENMPEPKNIMDKSKLQVIFDNFDEFSEEQFNTFLNSVNRGPAKNPNVRGES